MGAVELIQKKARGRCVSRVFQKVRVGAPKPARLQLLDLVDRCLHALGLRMQRATQQLANNSQLGKTRRDIARVKTVLTEKKKGAAK